MWSSLFTALSQYLIEFREWFLKTFLLVSLLLHLVRLEIFFLITAADIKVSYKHFFAARKEAKKENNDNILCKILLELDCCLNLFNLCDKNSCFFSFLLTDVPTKLRAKLHPHFTNDLDRATLEEYKLI